MRKTQKQNVSEFNSDIKENSGYRYTTNAPYSSIVANRRITKAILAAVPAGTATILDIGCGDGSYTDSLKLALPNATVTGFDPAAEAVSIARKKFPGIDFVLGDLLNPSTFPGQKFDVGVLRGVIHHLPDALAGISNATQLSDKIIIIEPNGNNPILKWIEKNSRYHIDHEEQSFSSRQLVQWCRGTGFQVTKIDFIGFVPMFFPSVLARIVYFFQPFLEWFHPLKKYFGAQIIIVYEKEKSWPATAGK
jgi:SAM-dependent methyltransferase